MNRILPHIPTLLIIALIIWCFVGYNKIVGNQARQQAIFEQTLKQMEDMDARHQIELDILDSLKQIIKKSDSLLLEQNKKLQWISSQNEVLYNEYKQATITLPDL